MLYIQFSIDSERYLLATDQVVMLMPVVQIHQVEQSTALFLGCINFKGEWLPVVDLVHLFANRPARLRLSTRIIIVKLQESGVRSRKVGLLVEKVSELTRLGDTSFVEIIPDQQNTPALDAQTHDEKGVLQRVRMAYLVARLPASQVCNELMHSQV